MMKNTALFSSPCVRLAALVVTSAVLGCIQSGIPPVGGTPAERLRRAESLYADVLDLAYQIEVTRGRGLSRSDRGTALATLAAAHRTLVDRAAESLAGLDPEAYGGEDRRAIARMRDKLLIEPEASSASPVHGCDFDAESLATRGGPGALTRATYTCYADRQSRVATPSDTTDRLTVLSRLSQLGDSAARRREFLSLAPVWESVNRRNETDSPYRVLVRLNAAEWRRTGSPLVRAAESVGIAGADLELTLVRILSAWRDSQGDEPSEPWDWFYMNDRASRELSPQVRKSDLLRINDRYFAALGASPRELGVSFDLEPRAGKSPVAFTQFGGQPRRGRGSNPWVVATYREGGFGNLVELLHETGHAMHIAAIDARPAFADWPDSDPFTEGLAEVPALEAWEPRWQQLFIGDSASSRTSKRGKYASTMLDVAWALFELRMHDRPGADPNRIWSDITSAYLRIAPHPEWSWWAMRGQLVESPGYMVNYALGAMIAADVRSRIARSRGPLYRAGTGTYNWLAASLYRSGAARPAREVLEDFLGRAASVDELLSDIRS